MITSFGKGGFMNKILNSAALVDLDLIAKYRKTKDESFYLALLKRYRSFIRELVYKVFAEYKYSKQLEYDDLFSIGAECLFKVIHTCDLDKPLKPYWMTVARRCMHNHASRNLRFFSEKIMSVDNRSVYEDNYLSSGVEDTYFNYKNSDIRVIAVKYVKEKKLAKGIQVFDMFMAGYKANEIAKALDLKASSVYRIISLIKEEIRKLYL